MLGNIAILNTLSRESTISSITPNKHCATPLSGALINISPFILVAAQKALAAAAQWAFSSSADHSKVYRFHI